MEYQPDPRLDSHLGSGSRLGSARDVVVFAEFNTRP